MCETDVHFFPSPPPSSASPLKPTSSDASLEESEGSVLVERSCVPLDDFQESQLLFSQAQGAFPWLATVTLRMVRWQKPERLSDLPARRGGNS